jgi:carboxylesterase type B
VTTPVGRVAQFRSIPFAKPPTGQLRWAAPVKNDCWSGTFDATQYGNFCAQGGVGSEDCLTLTLTVPENVFNGSIPSKVPTMAYFHVSIHSSEQSFDWHLLPGSQLLS